MKRLTLFILAVAAVLTVSAQQGSDGRRLYDKMFLEAVCQHQKGNDDAAFDLFSYCTRLDSTRSEAYYFLAQYYDQLESRRKGSTTSKKAMQMAKRAADLEPENATYLETLANEYMKERKFAEAARAVEQLYARNRSRSELLALLVQLYERTDDYDSAIDALNRLEIVEGVNERLSMAKSDLYTKKGDSKLAISCMKQLADQYPSDQNYRCLYANTLYVNGQKKKALKIYDDILRQEPENVSALAALTSHYRAVGDSLKASATAERIVLSRSASDDDRRQMLRQVIADSEEAGGDSTQVLALFRKLLAMPQTSGDMATLCASYMMLKKMPRDTVSAVLEHALQLSPDNVGVRMQLISYAWDDGRRDDVIALCREARQYTPTEMSFYYYQGIACYQKDDIDGALDAFRNGISVIGDHSDPDMVSDFYSVMGDLLHQRGQWQEAFAAYDSCLVWKPENIGCLNNYAYYLSERGERLDDAERMSYKTIVAEPKNATYLDTYAWILFMQKRYSEAKIYIDQTLRYDTDSSSVLLEHAGDIYFHTGDVDKAASYWQQALDKAEGSDQAAEDRRRLLLQKIKQRKYIKQ